MEIKSIIIIIIITIMFRIDSNGSIGAFLVERLNLGLNFILSAEIDYPKKDYKFGFGLTVGTTI